MLDFSRNHIGGCIPSFIWELSTLKALYLARNELNGSLHIQGFASLHHLEILDLSLNYIGGSIPSFISSLSSLKVLSLSRNDVNGSLPMQGKLSNDVTGYNYLEKLDISDNFLSGPIPNWIGNFTSILVFRNNSFEGQISHFPFTNAMFIDFSYNSLIGSLPHFTKSMFLEHLHLQGNKFTGSIPESYANLSSLFTLDLNDNNLSGNIPKFISALSSLRIILLGGNYFSGFIPNELCYLRNISLLDLSYNSLSGSIPKCLPNITGPSISNPGVSGGAFIFSWSMQIIDTYERTLTTSDYMRKYEENYADLSKILNEVDFRTKGKRSSYKGSILDFMSRLDLSCNNLSGEIPTQMGLLGQIHALNLSHNQLTGPIPKLFSQLTQIESLDISFNSLSGEIPLDLVNLTFLAVFIVTHNNLSGKVPQMRAQFGTFPKESYEGNPFLCGPQIEKNCTTLVTSSSPTASSDEDEEKWYEIDLVFFRASFVATYVVFLVGAVTILYINSHWRKRWFTLVEDCMCSCYYFFYDFLHV